MVKVPEIGAPISTSDMDMIFQAVKDRQEKFSDEPAALSFYLVISGIGERFRQVECLEQEWSGVRQDVAASEGAPSCPNGHPLVEGPGITIGWVPVD